ncbi:response regulator transcription factor [Paracoccus sp. JM45]|uniref:response regulator transcription factor n=1 Tax=Paracoccus sp. JM45 TaxID=2283626 RepID=UPI000E6C4CE3|nr:response regulator transcription factor [Paracoccus sp. JM45]RJE78489.1 DNA-binding response regulator [Paracoccus sp. JM45]
MRILLIEDDAGIGSAVRDQIAADGHLVDWATDLADARAFLPMVAYDLVLLDMMLPDGTGIALLRDLRQQGLTTPVIILTAMDRITDRIDGLNAGADDYLVKPFDLSELSARIGAVARRYTGNPNPQLRIGSFALDMAQRRVDGTQGVIDLSQREWIILEALLQNRGNIVAKSRLEDRLYSFDAEVESNTIEVYVSRLRKKLGRDSIETLRGLGYRVAR